MTQPAGAAPRTLATFTVPSVAGNERLVRARVAGAVAGEGIPARQLERLETAVTEAALNAMEHGNGFDPATSVGIEVMRAGPDVVVAVTDQGGRRTAAMPGEEPDLSRKLAGEQGPRGWGLFLIRHMVDAMEVRTDGPRRTVWLTLRAAPPRGGDGGGGRPVATGRD